MSGGYQMSGGCVINNVTYGSPLVMSGLSVPAEGMTVSDSSSAEDDLEAATSTFRLESRVARLERAMSSVLKFLQPAARGLAADSSVKRTREG